MSPASSFAINEIDKRAFVFNLINFVPLRAHHVGFGGGLVREHFPYVVKYMPEIKVVQSTLKQKCFGF